MSWDQVEKRPLSEYFTMREVAIIQMGNRHGMASKFELQLPVDKQKFARREYDQVMKNKQHYYDLIEKMKKIKANAGNGQSKNR